MNTPDKDMRALLIDAIDSCIPDDIPGYRQRYTDKAAERILTAFEVRPRGTVTDALARAWDEGFDLATRNNPNKPHPLARSNPYRGESRS